MSLNKVLVVIVLIMALLLLFRQAGVINIQSAVLSTGAPSINISQVDPAAQVNSSATLSLRNTGKGTLTATLTSDKSWLEVSPIIIKLDEYTPENTVTVKILNSQLSRGLNYTGHITIQSDGGNAVIPIIVSVPKYVFKDDFTDLSTGWLTLKEVKQYQNGNFRFIVKDTDHFDSTINTKIGDFNDFVYTVDAKWATQNYGNKNDYGLLFGHQIYSFYYYFSVNPVAGIYELYKKAGTWAPLIGQTPCSYIKTGSNVNRLAVECQGQNITLYINGNLITTYNDESYSGGNLGMAVENRDAVNYADAFFSNLTVIVP